MGRKDLNALIGRVDNTPQEARAEVKIDTEIVPSAPTVSPQEEEPKPSASTRSMVAKRNPKPVKAVATPSAPVGAIMDEFERKETWLRDDQVSELEAIAKRLNKAKDRDEKRRITANTLIRVGVDLLLLRSDLLNGSNEEQLRNSVTSKDLEA